MSIICKHIFLIKLIINFIINSISYWRSGDRYLYSNLMMESGLQPAYSWVFRPFSLCNLSQNFISPAASQVSVLRLKIASVILNSVLWCSAFWSGLSNRLCNKMTPGFSVQHLKQPKTNQQLQFVQWKQLSTEKTRTMKVGHIQTIFVPCSSLNPQIASLLTSNFLLDTSLFLPVVKYT